MTDAPPRRPRARRALLTLLAALTLATSAQAALLENIAPRPHDAPQGATLDSIAQSILQAASETGWLLVEESPGEIQVLLNVRNRHEATVSIKYDVATFAIDYVSSLNLDYAPEGPARPRRMTKAGNRRVYSRQAGPRIHGNYNKWVKELATQIARRIARPIATPAGYSATRRAAPPVMVADELEKLHRLFKQGVLTRDEFEAQKKKLLSR